MSLIWMIVEVAVAIGSGVVAHSFALVAFGADSIIELIAGGVLLWRLVIEMRGVGLEKVDRAERISSWVVGIVLLLLAVYIVMMAGMNLTTENNSCSCCSDNSLSEKQNG